MTTHPRQLAPAHRHDHGFVTAIEVVYIGIVAMVAVLFLGYLGRLSAAGLQVTNAAQDAARSASLQPNPTLAQQAASAAIARSSLAQRCRSTPVAQLTWEPETAGVWPGSVVTVTVSCQVANDTLTGIWTPGVRTVTVSDRQIVERFRQ